jgi:simple sugar transport system permease protein
MSTTTENLVGRLRAPKARSKPPVTRERKLGWAALAIAVLAFLVTIPPFTVRTMIPSVLLAAVALGLGVVAARGGEKRVGWGAIVLAVLAVVGAYGATRSGVGKLETVVSWSALTAAMLRYATPLLFAGLGGLVSERAGVVNVGLEGMMLMGAFFAAWGAAETGSWLVGILVGVLSGMALAAVHALFSVTIRVDQIVSGVALNFIALGLTGYLYIDIFGSEGTPDDLPEVPNIDLPTESLGFIGKAIANQNLLVWGSLAAALLVWVLIFRTPRGLRLRSVGENPRAAETVGISVERMRYGAVLASGALAALGGAFLSIGFVHSFTQNMSAGKGFIALAAVIFGRWHPFGLLGATMLFGFSSALAQRLPEFSPQAATLFQALPYVLTLIAVAGIVGRSTPPAADGVPYRCEVS